jgi:hypothetical protein
MYAKKSSSGRALILIGLSILSALLLWAAFSQLTFFLRIIANDTLGWRAAAGVFFRFILVLILAIGAGVGPGVFLYRRISKRRKSDL